MKFSILGLSLSTKIELLISEKDKIRFPEILKNEIITISVRCRLVGKVQYGFQASKF